jgi:hypothetical protein
MIVVPLSWWTFGPEGTFKWYRTVFFCGVRKIGYSFSKQGREDPEEV